MLSTIGEEDHTVSNSMAWKSTDESRIVIQKRRGVMRSPPASGAQSKGPFLVYINSMDTGGTILYPYEAQHGEAMKE